MLKRVFKLFQIARKFSTSGAVATINEIHQLPTIINLFFRLSRKPFVIGIAGDSGSGKDTLNDAITDLFGTNAVASLSGDDYHLWDRNKPSWQAMTHLNPMANDLERYANDLVSLIDGNDVFLQKVKPDRLVGVE